jgi:hypothetical protein
MEVSKFSKKNFNIRHILDFWGNKVGFDHQSFCAQLVETGEFWKTSVFSICMTHDTFRGWVAEMRYESYGTLKGGVFHHQEFAMANQTALMGVTKNGVTHICVTERFWSVTVARAFQTIKYVMASITVQMAKTNFSVLLILVKVPGVHQFSCVSTESSSTILLQTVQI